MYDNINAEPIKYDLSKSAEEPWWEMKPLTYLDLSSNTLIELPSKIGTFEDLLYMNVSDIFW